MLLDTSNSRGFIEDEKMKKWQKRYGEEVENFADYLIDYSKEYLEKENLISFKKTEVWGTKHEVAIASPAGDKLFDRLVQFNNDLVEIKLGGFTDNTILFYFAEFFWNTLYFKSEEVTEEFKKLIPNLNNNSGENNIIYCYWYWN